MTLRNVATIFNNLSFDHFFSMFDIGYYIYNIIYIFLYLDYKNNCVYFYTCIISFYSALTFSQEYVL